MPLTFRGWFTVLVFLLLIPVVLPTLSPSRAQPRLEAGSAMTEDDRLPLIDTDTLLYVENHGLDRIFFTVTGHAFRLVADSSEVERSANAFPIPRQGRLTIHIGALIEPGGDNYVRLSSQGPPEAEADVIIAPVFVHGQREIAYRIPSLEPLPALLRLEHYPNPFRDRVTLAYEIPSRRINGVDVVIDVYDLLGRRVISFDEGRRYPGRFTRTWHVSPGRASGYYFARVRVNGRPEATVKMVHVR